MLTQFVMLLAWALLPAATPRTHRVEISGFLFRPAEVHVQPGDTIVFINRDVVAHTATSASASWDTGALEKDAARKIVLRTRGAHSYICAYHPSMKGRVLVD
jgi:plastocyanin